MQRRKKCYVEGAVAPAAAPEITAYCATIIKTSEKPRGGQRITGEAIEFEVHSIAGSSSSKLVKTGIPETPWQKKNRFLSQMAKL